MDYYCDIQVLPDPEATEPVLISNLMSKLHRTLVKLGSTNVAVSFPKVERTLGNILRVHSSKNELSELMKVDWLKGLRDYCTVTPLTAIPENVQFRVVKRVQSKSVHNKRKRSIAKGWLTAADAHLKITEKQELFLKLPFIQLNSTSTKQHMKMFIEHGELTEFPIKGDFNTYGLSGIATVPWF